MIRDIVDKSTIINKLILRWIDKKENISNLTIT